MIRIADRISRLPRAGNRVIFDAAQGLADVIHLEIGQPDFATPAMVCAGATRAIQCGKTRYTANAGVLELRQAIAQHLQSTKGVDVTAANLVVTTGGMGALATTMEAILNDNDEVLLPDPGWPNYGMQVMCAGGKPVYYNLLAGNRYQPDPDEIARLITPRTKAILMNSPSNPTGAVFTPDVVERIIRVAREHGVAIIADEVYEQITFGCANPSFLRPDTLDITIAVYSFSKTYAMTGWRVGYVVAPIAVAEELTKLQEVYYACASSVSQAAAQCALMVSTDEIDKMVCVYQRRREIVAEELSAAGVDYVVPDGAFYCLVGTGTTGMSSMEFSLKLLQATHVAVAPGESFGRNSRHTVRICFAVPDDVLREGVRRLASFITSGSDRYTN